MKNSKRNATGKFRKITISMALCCALALTGICEGGFLPDGGASVAMARSAKDERVTTRCSTTLPDSSGSYYTIKADGTALDVDVVYKAAPDGLRMALGINDTNDREVTFEHSDGGFKSGKNHMEISGEGIGKGNYSVVLYIEREKESDAYCSVYGVDISMDGKGWYFPPVSTKDTELTAALAGIHPEWNLAPGIVYMADISEQMAEQGDTTLHVSREYAGYMDEMIRTTEKLTSGLKSNEQKAAKIYGWIVDHSMYDTAGADRGDMTYNNNPLYLWMRPYGEDFHYGAGVCAGMAKLFRDMCTIAGIPAINVVVRVTDTAFHLQTVFYLEDRQSWFATDITGDVPRSIKNEEGRLVLDQSSAYGGQYWHYGIPLDSVDLYKFDYVGARGLAGFDVSDYGQTTFAYGEDFRFTGSMSYLYVEGTETSDEKRVGSGEVAPETVTELVQGYDKNQSGRQTVTFRLGGQSVTWEIIVSEP